MVRRRRRGRRSRAGPPRGRTPNPHPYRLLRPLQQGDRRRARGCCRDATRRGDHPRRSPAGAALRGPASRSRRPRLPHHHQARPGPPPRQAGGVRQRRRDHRELEPVAVGGSPGQLRRHLRQGAGAGGEGGGRLGADVQARGPPGLCRRDAAAAGHPRGGWVTARRPQFAESAAVAERAAGTGQRGTAGLGEHAVR